MNIFVDDDSAYVHWVGENPNGYVVNTYRQPSRSYLVLHRSNCRTVTGKPTHGAEWTVNYAKVCSNDLAELAGWARQNFELQRIVGCKNCKPRSGQRPAWPLKPGDSLQRTDLHGYSLLQPPNPLFRESNPLANGFPEAPPHETPIRTLPKGVESKERTSGGGKGADPGGEEKGKRNRVKTHHRGGPRTPPNPAGRGCHWRQPTSSQ